MPSSATEDEEAELASFPPAVAMSEEKLHAPQPRPFLFTPLREDALSPSPLAVRKAPTDCTRCPQQAVTSSPSFRIQPKRPHHLVNDRLPLVVPQQHGCVFTAPFDEHATGMAAPCLAAPAPAACHFGGEPVPFRPRPPYAPYFGAAPAGLFGGADEPPCASPITPAAFPYMLRPEPVRAENPVQHQEEQQQHNDEEEEEVANFFAAANIMPGSAMVVAGAAML